MLAIAKAQSRVGPPPSRTGEPTALPALASTCSGCGPQIRSSAVIEKNASPGAAGSTSAPIASSRCSDRSHSDSARFGSGGTRISAGQRESASESAIPARIPNASAAPLASPIDCSPPGSGASAAGCASISRRSPSAAIREKRGMRTQPTVIREANVCSPTGETISRGVADSWHRVRETPAIGAG